MKLFVLILLNYSLLIFAQSQLRNLTEIIVNKQKEGNATIYINLDNNSYYLTGNVVVGNLTEFTLVGNKNTTVYCKNKAKFRLMIVNVIQVTFKDIVFEECNKHLIIQEQLPKNLAFFHFHECVAVNVSKCKFKNVYGLSLLSNRTKNLTVEDSEFLIESDGPSKAIMSFSNEINSYYSSLEVKRNVFSGMNWSLDHTDDQAKGENFSIKCGSVLSVFYRSNGSSLIHIADNIFNSYKSAQGGAVCVLIGDYHTNSRILIERGSFMKGNITEFTPFRGKFHEKPKGGAIALFLYAKDAELSINHCNFTDNKSLRGGAVYIDYSNEPIVNEIENCRFENNNGFFGGALMLTSSLAPEGISLNLTNCTFIGNTAVFAGAILGFRVSININDHVKVASNEVRGNGGGIGLIYSYLFVNGQLIVANNTAYEGGGGIYLSSQCKIIMNPNGSELNITGNKAATYGGGIYAYTLEYHNLFINSNVNNKFRHWCFLLGNQNERNRSTIVLLENKVNSKPCAGDTGYTQMLGKCFDTNIIRGRIISDNTTTCKNDTREMYFNITISPRNYIHCNFSSLSEGPNYNPIYRIKLSKYCEQSGTFDQLVMENDHVTLKTILKLNKHHPNIDSFYYMYPGYVANISIWSKDFFNYSVETRANLTGWIFAGGHNSKNGYEYIIMSENNAPKRSFLTIFSSSVTMRSKWKGLGVICVQSIRGFYNKFKCIGVIMGNCPPGFSLGKGENQNQCGCNPNKKWYSCAGGNNISVNRGYYIANKYVIRKLDEIKGTNCLLSRCKCTYGAPKNDCLLNTMFPDDQCHSGLKGILCGNCIDPTKALFFSPFLYSLEPFKGCIECKNPFWSILLFISLIIAVGLAIMLFRVNLFADYWRSIIFYSNILYMILVNSNPYLSQFTNIALAIPILPLNLLVTQIVPFCLSTENNTLYTAIFDMTVPWIVMLIFYSLQRFLVTKVSWLSTRNVPTQIWSMLLLTYTDLSIHVFMILTCPVIGDNRYWLYHGDTICYQKQHLGATLMSLFYMFVLTSIPLFLLFILFCTENDFQFHHNITRGFKYYFRWWEIYKLLLRLVISFMLSYLSNYLNPTIITYSVAIICLFTMILNSLFQPANNVISNHFESLCLLSLALTIILQGYMIVNYTLLIPLLVGAALVLIHQKIPLWHGQIKKIRAEIWRERRVIEKVITIFKIWDVKNNYELDSM